MNNKAENYVLSLINTLEERRKTVGKDETINKADAITDALRELNQILVRIKFSGSGDSK